MQEVAVLTGDIVKSSALPADALTRLFDALEAGVAEIATWPEAPTLLTFSRHRGDGWQLVLGKPAWALRVSLFLRAAIRAAGAHFETRIGLGLGPADKIDTSHPGAASGPAFERSGRCLDGLRKSILFGIDTGADTDAARLLNSVFVMADALSSGWTQRQAEVFSFVLHPNSPSQAEIGARLSPPISQPGVTDHYLVGNGPALFEALAAVEAITD